MIPANFNRFPAMHRLVTFGKLRLKWVVDWVTCKRCNGLGKVLLPPTSIFADHVTARCYQCDGIGLIPDNDTKLWSLALKDGGRDYAGLEFTPWFKDFDAMEAHCYQNEPAIMAEILDLQ